MADEPWASRCRRWINSRTGRWVAAGVCAVLLAAAASAFLRDETDQRAKGILKKGHTVYYYCKACKATGKTLKPYDQPFPITCPKCGAPQAVEAFRCRRCGRIIENIKGVEVFYCPHPDCRFKYSRRVIGD